MPWKVGGNFETAAVTCEDTNWKECVNAVANYLWCEVVSDVVDYLAKEGFIWVLAIAIASTMFIRIKYYKNMHTENTVLNKRVLNKIGYKVQDLELKINVLTYKMQYGTWPLPHEICNLNPKLRKIRMTLSNPSDRKNWLKHMLDLNLSLESNVYAPYSKALSSTVAKPTNSFDIKPERAPQHVKHGELPACSSIETLKSTSDQSANIYSQRPRIYSRSTSMKENDLSKSKDFTLQRRNVQFLPLNSDVTNHQSSKMTSSLTQNAANAKNAKYTPCQKFTETVYKCKSFLKELQRKDKCLRSLYRSSKMNKGPSLKTTHTTKQTTLSTTEQRETSCDASVTRAKRKEINEIKCMERIKDNTVKGVEETYRQNKVDVSNGADRQNKVDVSMALKINNRAPSRELVPVIPIIQSTHNTQPSQETLVEVRRRLQSLHNVLQTYQDASQSPERQESTDRVDEIDSFITYPVVDISSEYFELNRSEESLSSLTEYSSHTSKTYQRSSGLEGVTLRNTSKEFSRHDVRRSVRSDLPAFVTAESHLCSRNALQTPEKYESGYKGIACEKNILDRSRNHELESSPEASKDTMKTDTLFNMRDNVSQAVSERIFYILSPENKNIQTQNDASLDKRFAEKFSNVLDNERYQENVTTSQNSSRSKISYSNNREEKSTAMLLQEALHFKKALLTHTKKKCPISNVKQDDIADESSPITNNNFPSMIIDIKEEEPVVSNTDDKINQRYICLDMKQRRDSFPQSLKKVDTLAHHEDERDTESQDCTPETSSEYFSITDLAIHKNSETENNVSSKPPIYEKVISITIPVNVKSQSEINMNERPMQMKAVLRNIQTRVNLRESAASDIDSDVADKRSPTMLKLEDLILERVKNIRDYMDTFLQSQNTAIFNARRALQCQGKDDTFRCSNEASHVVIYNRSLASSSCNSTDQLIVSSKKSSDFLTNTWPNYVEEYKEGTDDILKRSSDVYLKRNPGMFTLVTPIKNKFFDKNVDTRQSEVPAELERKEADLSPLTYSCKNNSKPTHRITDSIMPCRGRHIVPNTENDNTDKGTIVDVNADFYKRRKQTQITESKPLIMSYFPIDVANADAKVTHVAHEEYPTKSNSNSISHSNSYFTDEEITSDANMNNVSSKSTSNTYVTHSHAKLNVQKEMKQNVIKRQISEYECPDANMTMPNELASEYSNLTLLIDSNLERSERDYLTNAKTASPLTMLKKNEFIFEPDASLLPLLLAKEKRTLNTDSILLNNLKKNDEISIVAAHLLPRTERYSTKPFQKYSQVKSKSDTSLIINRRKGLKVNIYPKKSYSFLITYNTKYISGVLHQPCAKLHNDENKCIKNKLRLTTQSKSTISPRKVSTKSCIPILKNHIESSHRMKHQAQARSPTRSPLTMLWGEKTCTKDHARDKKVARSDNVSMSKYLRVDKTVSNLTKLNNPEKDILNKESERSVVTYRDSNAPKKNLGILSSDQNVESLAIDKKHSDKKDIYGSKSDTSIMQHIKKIASKELVVISIMANDSLRKTYPADLFILNTKNINSATDLLIHKNKLWTVTKEKTEKEVTAKPSITDTCTSMSNLQ